MAETTAQVRRDIELTRERMSDTLAQLERKMNVMEIVRDHPWPSVALAAGVGFLLAGSRADVKAAAATVAATGGASSKLAGLLDDLAAGVVGGVSASFNKRLDNWLGDVKTALGVPQTSSAADVPPGAARSRIESRTGNGPGEEPQPVGHSTTARESGPPPSQSLTH